MKLSVVIPVYNVSAYLPKCLDSLLCQDLTDCEIILINDGSTDGRCGEICDEYAYRYPEIIRAYHQKNAGLGAARNRGVSLAKGEYVLFVDSDDYVSEHMIQTLKQQMEQDPDIVIFAFSMVRGEKTELILSEELPFGRTVSLSQAPELLLAPPNAWSKLCKRALFIVNSIAYPDRLWFEDIATTAKLLARAEKINVISDDLYRYVLRDGSITHSRNVLRNMEIITAVQMILDWYRDAGLYETYQTELEALTVRNVFMDASGRLLKAALRDQEDWKERLEILEKLRRFTYGEFPEWRKNPYIRTLSGKRRIVLSLLDRRCYFMVRLLYCTSDRLKRALNR